MTAAETQLCLTLLAYAVAVASSLVIGYLAWRKIRPHRRDYRYHQHQDGHDHKGVWGWE